MKHGCCCLGRCVGGLFVFVFFWGERNVPIFAGMFFVRYAHFHGVSLLLLLFVCQIYPFSWVVFVRYAHFPLVVFCQICPFSWVVFVRYAHFHGFCCCFFLFFFFSFFRYIHFLMGCFCQICPFPLVDLSAMPIFPELLLSDMPIFMTVSIQPPCAIVCISSYLHICTLKIPNAGSHVYHCWDT